MSEIYLFTKDIGAFIDKVTDLVKQKFRTLKVTNMPFSFLVSLAKNISSNKVL